MAESRTESRIVCSCGAVSLSAPPPLAPLPPAGWRVVLIRSASGQGGVVIFRCPACMIGPLPEGYLSPEELEQALQVLGEVDDLFFGLAPVAAERWP